VFLAGIPVAGDLLVVLAKLVKDARLAEKLEAGVNRDVIAIGLDEAERTAVLKALADPPPGLETVRDTLLADRARLQPGILAVDSAA
jgi:hypothetical protein